MTWNWQLIADLRGRIQLTQLELAKRAKINVSTIERIEKGEIKRPRANTLARLASALGVDVTRLRDAPSPQTTAPSPPAPSPPAPSPPAPDGVRLRATLAQADASKIVLGRSLGTADTINLSDVYVERAIEGPLVDYLWDDSGAPKLVVGDAGMGKTSLLWSLARKAGQFGGLEPLFISAHMLRELQPESLIPSAERRTVLLLDTVDLLLHTERDRTHLHLVLAQARMRECKVIMTCRPLEAARIEGIERDDRLNIDEYDDRELEATLAKHVYRFYAREELLVREEHLHNLQNLVAGHHPMERICRHPLTLRMLFVLYAPGAVPRNIDTASLYSDYWRRRVCLDWRAGSPAPSEGALDLSSVTGWVAARMLGEGIAQLPLEQTRYLVDKGRELGHHNLRGEVVDALVDRGIFVSVDNASVAFFHQSFLEYSAAWGIVQHIPREGLTLLTDRTISQRDMLAAAVLEQALVIETLRHTPITTLLTALLGQTESPLTREICIAVYSRRPSALRDFQQQVDASLHDEKLAYRFVQLLPSVGDAALAIVFEHLAGLWPVSTWPVKMAILTQLPALARRAPEQAFDFFRTLRVLDTTFAHVHGPGANHQILVILATLAPHVGRTPEFWDMLMKLCERRKGSYSQDFLASVLEMIASCSDALGREHIAADVTAHVRTSDTCTSISRAMGLVWAAEWRAARRPMSTLLDEISLTHDDVHFRWKLTGLGVLLREASRTDGEVAWHAFMAETITARIHWWGKCTWKTLFTDAGTTPSIPSDHIAALLVLDRHSAPPHHRKAIIMELHDAGMPDSVASRLFGKRVASEPGIWLREDGLSGLLFEGYTRGHAAAQQAVQRLFVDPHRALGRKFLNGFCNQSPARWRGPECSTALSLAISLRERATVRRLLEDGDWRWTNIPSQHAEALRTILHEDLAGEPIHQADAAASLLGLLTRGQQCLEPRETELVLRAITAHVDRVAVVDSELRRSALLGLVRVLAHAGDGEIPDAMASCCHVASSSAKDMDLKEAALGALVRLIEREGSAHLWSERVTLLAVAAPTRANIIRQAWNLLDRLVPSHLDDAALLVRRVLECEVESNRSNNELHNTLIVKLRVFMLAALPKHRHATLALVPGIPTKHGSLVVQAAGAAAYLEVRPQLVKLLDDAKVDEGVKRTIRGLESRRRGEISTYWPGLLEQLDRPV